MSGVQIQFRNRNSVTAILPRGGLDPGFTAFFYPSNTLAMPIREPSIFLARNLKHRAMKSMVKETLFVFCIFGGKYKLMTGWCKSWFCQNPIQTRKNALLRRRRRRN